MRIKCIIPEASEDFLHNLPATDSMSADEEAMWVQRANNGDQYAMNELVSRNLRFIRHKSQSVFAELTKKSPSIRYKGENADCFQLGAHGFIHAISKFNPKSGVRLCSYAGWWIIRYVRGYFKLWYMRMPLRERDKYETIDTTSPIEDKIMDEQLSKTLFHDLTQEERNILTKHLGIGVDKMLKIEIANELGIGRNAVARKYSSALTKIKENMARIQ